MPTIDELIGDLQKLKGTVMPDAQQDVAAIAHAAADLVKAEVAAARKALLAKLGTNAGYVSLGALLHFIVSHLL